MPGPATERIGSGAKKQGVHLVVGVIERAGGTLYCSSLTFGPDGRLLGKHRKLMPTAMERVIWGTGVGYWLDRAHWGKGITSRALRLLLQEVTKRPLVATAAISNGASLRVLQKCGFAVEQVRRDPATDRYPECEVAVLVLR